MCLTNQIREKIIKACLNCVHLFCGSSHGRKEESYETCMDPDSLHYWMILPCVDMAQQHLLPDWKCSLCGQNLQLWIWKHWSDHDNVWKHLDGAWESHGPAHQISSSNPMLLKYLPSLATIRRNVISFTEWKFYSFVATKKNIKRLLVSN